MFIKHFSNFVNEVWTHPQLWIIKGKIVIYCSKYSEVKGSKRYFIFIFLINHKTSGVQKGNTGQLTDAEG